ncbi:selenide, water dikinase SelD [Listeria costaricensis]|uniref:selenide, water dikinase SelD n=1 Tax=Listeria costaricensis TaxID=2026604 RepID=UPI0013C45718|nr:selenide, water dikinase SelD [Listeria costaricensis]
MSKDLIICGGCNAKMGVDVLSGLLKNIQQPKSDQLLVGFDHADDAAVIRLTEELALIQTVDFFPAMVADPYHFGRIAACNALSDVYAMGGQPITALNLVCYPEEQPLDPLEAILKGGMDILLEAGVILAGGHSIHDPKIKYGLSVSGTIHPAAILTNRGAELDDRLVLTKPLGTGLITTGYSVGEVEEADFAAALNSMETLNKAASEAARDFHVHAMTDVTGFGLLGHLSEMIAEEQSVELTAANIPILSGAKEAAAHFLGTAGGQRNRNHLQEVVDFQEADFALEEVLFDPQTSGGLLIALPKTDAEQLCLKLQQQGLTAQIIGRFTEKAAHSITIR